MQKKFIALLGLMVLSLLVFGAFSIFANYGIDSVVSYRLPSDPEVHRAKMLERWLIGLVSFLVVWTPALYMAGGLVKWGKLLK